MKVIDPGHEYVIDSYDVEERYLKREAGNNMTRAVRLPFEVTSNPPFPLRLYKPGSEWLVELCWPEDADGHVAVCGLFHSTDYAAAKSFYGLAHRIISCWHVDTLWHNEGKLTFDAAAEGGGDE